MKHKTLLYNIYSSTIDRLTELHEMEKEVDEYDDLGILIELIGAFMRHTNRSPEEVTEQIMDYWEVEI